MAETLKSSLQKIIGYFRQHFKEDFHPGYYITIAIMLVVSISLNYFLIPGKTVERWITNNFYGQELCILIYICFYGLPYYLTSFAYAYFHKDWSHFRSPEFWIKSLLGITLLSIDASFYYYRYSMDLVDGHAAKYVVRKCAGTLISAVVVFIPLWLFKKWYDKRQENLYGLTFKGFDWKPYVVLLGLMVPLVVGASFTEGFISYYPTLKPHLAGNWTEVPVGVSLGIYETLYAIDFIWTELIFRGFMVIGLAAVVGNGAILPAVSIYAFRHFAKPLGETIGSVFGGFILGVIALRSKNIMGGVFVHMGIALLMELMAILQRYVIQ